MVLAGRLTGARKDSCECAWVMEGLSLARLCMVEPRVKDRCRISMILVRFYCEIGKGCRRNGAW